MTTSAEVIRRKYAKRLIEFGRSGGSYISRETAIFALQSALDELEEVWQDEHASVLRKLEVEQGWGKAQAVALENMGRCLADKINELEQTQLHCDALEGECVRLMAKTNGSLSAMSAPMAQSEAGASSTSSTAGPMPSSPVESSGESGAAGERVLSARTLRRRTQGRSTPKPEKRTDEEVGDTASLDPIDWRAALADILTTNQLDRLESRQLKWGRLDPQLQKMLVIRIAETILRQRGDISQSLYGEHMPDWATQVGSWIATTDLTWRQVLTHLGVVPSMQRKESRIGRYASSV